MSRNGSGQYSFPATTWDPAVNGVTATTADWNAREADVAAALTASVSKDGQTAMTGNLPMGNNRVTGMAAAASLTDAANANDVQSGRLAYLTGVSGTNTIAASLTGFTTYAAGNAFRFVAAGTNTGPVTLNVNAVAAKALTKAGLSPLVAGDLVANGTYEAIYDGTQFQLVTATRPARSYLSGLGTSTAGSSATFSVAVGEAADSTNTVLLQLATAISKTTSAWALGTAVGGLDTGAIANSTWYHAYLIRRPDTGVVDLVFSTSATAPTLPASYTQYRRIGALRTNGSAQWTSFVQDGDFFQWLAPTLDVNSTSAGTAAVTRTLTSPLGVNVRALLNVYMAAGGAGEAVYVSDLAVTDLAASNSTSPLNTMLVGGSTNTSAQIMVRTNTSAQIRTRQNVGGASEILRLATLGWYDTRGRDL